MARIKKTTTPGVRVEPVEAQPLFLHGVLHACLLEIVQNHRGEVLLLAATIAEELK
jgi:hypothetical protein